MTYSLPTLFINSSHNFIFRPCIYAYFIVGNMLYLFLSKCNFKHYCTGYSFIQKGYKQDRAQYRKGLYKNSISTTRIGKILSNSSLARAIFTDGYPLFLSEQHTLLAFCIDFFQTLYKK